VGEDKDLRGLFIKSENIMIGAFINSYSTAHFLIGTIDLITLEITYRSTLP